MIGTTLAHYRITAALGAGGMGEVWKAEDTKLGREVALKVLSEEFADNPERLDRFEREARAVAALNHPHIVTIFSVEEANGVRFLTMELIQGRSLDKLIPEGGLDLASFLELATPLAGAISAAHDKSVIHRDLKPSNVMVDGENRVKVLDFGLAKLQQAEGVSESTELPTEALTGVGVIVGTVPYMSPEQIEGKIVDHRTDIFSLGILLYEMALGERPFSGASQPALMSSILKDAPQSVVEVRDDLPRHLGRVIGRCLEKDRRDRYQTARDVFNELKALQRESSSSTGASAATPLGVGSVSARSAQPSSDVSATGSTRRDEGFWVAVLPFQCRAADPSIDALAEGLTEDIVTGLSRFSYLRVISRSSTSRFSGQTVDVRAVGEELGARYIMEGSIRQAGSVLRVAIQLVDTETGAHVWAETYNRPFKPEEIFELQDDLAPRIVSTVADMNGILPHTMSESIRSRPLDQLSPYEAMLRGFGYYVRLSTEDHLVARDCLENAVAEDPGNADCWALLSVMYAEEHKHGFNVKPDSLDRSLEAARKAVAIAPSNHFARHAEAQALFFRRELQAFRIAAERAVALNPMDGCTTAFMGILMAYAGQWDEGCALAEKAMQLNAQHPGWYRFSIFLNAYRKKDYKDALDVALKINMPTYFFTHASLASVYGQLGDQPAARQAVRDLLTQKPDFAATAREDWGHWLGPGELLEHLLDGLRKAGLEVDEAGRELTDRDPSEQATTAEATESIAIAVLPFTDMSSAKDQDYFCEGMAEEIMNALVHVDGIRVASRTSAFQAVEEGKDLQAIGRALSVGQVLEGSVRIAGSRLRVTAQLTEIESGYQLWSERYDREAADVFAIQDEIAVGVVEAVKARLGSGEHTVPSRVQVGNLEAYQLYLKGRHYRYSKNDHASALTCFEEAVAIDPEHAPSWAGLAEATILASVYSLVPILEAYQTAKDSLAIALDLQGESAEGCYVEGMIAFCEARWQDAEEALRRAVEFQPTFVQAHCWLGFLFSVLCRREEAESAFATARELDPLAAYPYAMTACGRITSGLPREAIDDAGQAMTFDHENTLALYCSGIAKVATGAFQEGVEELKKAAQHSRRGAFILGIFGWGLAAGGRIEEAEAILEELESRPKPAPTVVTEAWIRAALGDFEGAWEVLGRAEEEHQAILYFAGMPPFDPLRADPRFDALLERLGLPPTPSAQPVDSPVGIGEIAEKSIAVLPFVNRSGNPDDEYFSDGLSEELINALSRIPGLKVTARSSAFQFRGQELDVRDVGRKLGVATVLEGSVRISGSRLRITAELVNCADGYQIWSERFDREMTDIFDTQDEIARVIVAKLHVEIDGAREEPLVVVGTENMEAYRLYLKARYLRGKEDHDGARRVFEEAIRLDPSFAPSWTGLAEINGLAAHFNLNPAREGCAAARKALTTAAALQGESADALHVEGLVAFIERRWAAMEAAWRRALELQPTHVLALGGFGLSLCTRQRLDEALPFLERARQADPLASFPYARTAVGFLANGRPEEGLRYAEDALTFEKEDVTALFASCMANVALGRLEEGIEAAEHAVALSRRGVVFLGLLGWALATAGRNGEARAILKELRARPAASPAVVSEAWLLGALGEIDVAFDVLARAEEECQAFLNYTGMPAFDPLRADPRFAALVERFGLSSPPSAAQAEASPAEVSPELPRLAVLPFVDHSSRQDQDWFAAGTHEALLTALQQINGLRVTSRTSSMRYRETSLSMPEISEELRVRWLVEGSVARAGDQVRVSASLIDGADDQQAWSGQFERDVHDILGLQNEIAQTVARQIRVVVTPEEEQILATTPRVDPDAYREYVMGLQHFDQVTPEDFRQSVAHFEKAVSIDPDFAPAHVAIVISHGIAVEYGWQKRSDAEEEVRRSLKAAQRLSPQSGEALHAEANYQFHMERDLVAAKQSYRSAMKKTSNAYVRFELGWLLSRMGRHGEAVAVLEEAVLLDPRSPLIRCDLGWWLYGARDYDRAIEEARFALEIDPEFPESHWLLAAIYAQQDRFEESLAEYELYESLYGEPVLWFRGYLLGLAGRREEALQILDELEQLDPSGGEVAQIHLGLGDHEKVIEALEKADAPGVWFQPHLWPEYEALHGEPRFRAILDKFSIPLSEVQG